jgi:DNA-directed RNA polymerase subunit RPC12/RpoP
MNNTESNTNEPQTLDVRCQYCGHYNVTIAIIGMVQMKCRYCKKHIYKKLIPSDMNSAYKQLLHYKPAKH